MGILSVFQDGLGGGALGVPLFGMAGGYALAGSLTWVRALRGVVAMSTIPIWALTATSFAPHLAVDSPRGAWTALYYYSLLLLVHGDPHAGLRDPPPGQPGSSGRPAAA